MSREEFLGRVYKEGIGPHGGGNGPTVHPSSRSEKVRSPGLLLCVDALKNGTLRVHLRSSHPRWTGQFPVWEHHLPEDDRVLKPGLTMNLGFEWTVGGGGLQAEVETALARLDLLRDLLPPPD